MRPLMVPFGRGWVRRGGKNQPNGSLLLARNARFLPGDLRSRLWTVLGRSKFSTLEIDDSPEPVADEAVLKSLFIVEPTDGQLVVVAHKGSAFHEAPIGLIGAFSHVPISGESNMRESALSVSQRGIPATYRGETQQSVWLYPQNRDGGAGLRGLLVRDASGWQVGGHARPDVQASLQTVGSGSLSSTTEVFYCFRIYDETTDTESQHGDFISIAPFSSKTAVRITFTVPVVLQDHERGTHLRVYRSLLSEEAGIFYRVDPLMVGYVEGKGVPLPISSPGSYLNDTATNTQAQSAGIVRADGEEGTLNWAEHGGPPPPAGGLIVYGGHVVAFDIHGREQEVIYAASGYPECFPVDNDGNYAYWIRINSSQNDRILRCTLAGQYLLLLCVGSVHRIDYLPTLREPGFGRRVAEVLTTTNGVVGRFAASQFGVGPDQALRTLYLSAELGLMLCDGVQNSPVLQELDILSLIDKASLANVEIVNYPRFQEMWLIYRRAENGSGTNNAAVVIDYSQYGGLGLRATGPIDVTSIATAYASIPGDEGHLFLLDPDRNVYLQDCGTVDAQQNSGDIDVIWEVSTARYFPHGKKRDVYIQRGIAYGGSGEQREISVTHYAQDGEDEYSVTDKFRVGAGETTDVFAPMQTGQSFREVLLYTGEVGSNYTPDDPNCAMSIENIEYEYEDQGPVGTTRTEEAE